MTRFIFATESYGFSADLKSLLTRGPDDYILLTKDVHHTMPEADLALFSEVIEVPQFDVPSLLAALERFSGGAAPMRIVSHDDFFYLELAEVSALLGFDYPSRDAFLPFVDKDVAKQRLRDSGILTPRYRILDRAKARSSLSRYADELAADVGFPMFAKPTQGAGAEHCCLIPDRQRLMEWMECSTRTEVFEIDEYIDDAVLYHCDSVISGGAAVFTQVARYSAPCAEFANGVAVGSYTLPATDPVSLQLQAFAADVMRALGRHTTVPDGVTHLEVFRKSDGRLIFLEVQFRPPGANVKRAYREHLGVNLEDIHFSLQLGRSLVLPAASGQHAAWIYFPTPGGIIESLAPLPPLCSDIIEQWHGAKPGDSLTRPQSILDAKGRGVVLLSLVIGHDDHATLRDDFIKLSQFIPYQAV